jgi:hypothetical protein
MRPNRQLELKNQSDTVRDDGVSALEIRAMPVRLGVTATTRVRLPLSSPSVGPGRGPKPAPPAIALTRASRRLPYIYSPLSPWCRDAHSR